MGLIGIGGGEPCFALLYFLVAEVGNLENI